MQMREIFSYVVNVGIVISEMKDSLKFKKN